jgi:hypothetical protein
MAEKPKGGARPGAGRKEIEVIPSTRKRGTPTVSMDDLEALCQLGATNKQIAAYFRITERSLYKLKARNKELAELMDTAIERGNIRLLKEVSERIGRSDAVLIFTLKNRLGWTDRLRSENEHSGPGGKPIEMKANMEADIELIAAALSQIQEAKSSEVEPAASVNQSGK